MCSPSKKEERKPWLLPKRKSYDGEDISFAEAQVPQDKSRTFEPGGKSSGSVSKVKIQYPFSRLNLSARFYSYIICHISYRCYIMS